MTKKEAINTLKAVKVSLKIYSKRKKQKESVTALSEAIDMAIEALSQPNYEKGTWYDITEMLTYCDVNENCEECPRYADDCDGRGGTE